jgi:hypothetical protein
MAGHKSCYTMIEPIHLGETGKLARRNFLRSAGVLVSALSCMPTQAAPDNRQGSVHPPEPAGQEFDMLRLPNSRSPNRPVPDLRGRSQEFSRCLDQLFITPGNQRAAPDGGVLSPSLQRDPGDRAPRQTSWEGYQSRLCKCNNFDENGLFGTDKSLVSRMQKDVTE